MEILSELFFTSRGSTRFKWHSFLQLLAWRSLLWLSMTWWQRFLTQKFFLSIPSLTWSLALHLLFCSVTRSIYGERKETRARAHTHTHTHTHKSTIFLTTSMWNGRKLRFYVFSHFHATKHMILWVDPSYKKFWILFQFSLGTRGPIIGRKLTISCALGPLQVKLWYHMFFVMKMEECIDSELSSTFPVKLVAKNICLDLWRPKAVLSLQCDVSLWRKIQIL